MSDADERAARLAERIRFNRGFIEAVPHNKALGLELVELGEATTTFRLKYDAKLIGNLETGTLHGGAITTLLDSCCGSAVFQALPEPTQVATLDLRIDYLRPGDAGRDVLARATCYKVTRNVAFVRALAYHDDENDPIASANGTFMIAPRTARKGGQP
jgi:uncharacterized protein (TIGR00369 family)